MDLLTERIRVYKGERGKRKSYQSKWDDIKECPYCNGTSYFSMSMIDGMVGRGSIPMFDEDGNSIKSSDYQSVALYYCPKCMKFIAHNNMA